MRENTPVSASFASSFSHSLIARWKGRRARNLSYVITDCRRCSLAGPSKVEILALPNRVAEDVAVVSDVELEGWLGFDPNFKVLESVCVLVCGLVCEETVGLKQQIRL